jgi:hypothetical protein
MRKRKQILLLSIIFSFQILKMEVTELLKKVRKIEIKTKGLTNHIFSGEYHSAFKGRGMSFSEVREYQYGDDIRILTGMSLPAFSIRLSKCLRKNGS